MRRLWSILFVLLLPAALAAQSSATVEQAIQSIKPSDILHRIGVIADDSMKGRDTPSRELDLTAKYIANQFREFGLKPAGDDGGFIQHYPLLRIARQLAVETSTGVTWSGGEEVLQLSGGEADSLSGSTFIVSGSGTWPPDVFLSGAIVILSAESDGRRGLSSETQELTDGLRKGGAAAIIVATNFPERTWELLQRRQGTSQLGGLMAHPS